MKKLYIFSLSLFSVFSVSAQTWVQEGNNLSTSNLGTVLVKTPSNRTSATRFAVVPSPEDGVRMVIGEPNLATGGFTSLSLEVSQYQNGHGVIQAIKSSGSAYGTLALNPSGGTVTIGTAALPEGQGDFKLAVKGRIAAQEIKVFLNTWPDYVFSPGYPLMSLQSLNAFIKEHKHLPNIPAAREVKENGGVDLGAMNVKLLEKIEELTLHVIALNEQVVEQKKRIEELEKKSKGK